MIPVPDPALVLLVGAAGSGKSTLATRLFAADEILSSDALREALSGDAADQSVSHAAFSLLHEQAASRLRSGRLAVIDATNVERRARVVLLDIARAARVPAIAIVLDLPEDVVLERNRRRPGRVVPDGVVRRQLGRLRASLAGGTLQEEGFASVFRVSDAAEVERLTIRRLQRRA
jgi:protein phosphatase